MSSARRVRVSLDNMVDRVMTAIATAVRDGLVEATPVDTGTARDSWTLEESNVSDGLPARVYTPLDYMEDLNEGISPQQPEPGFVGRAVLDSLTKVPR